MIDSSSTAPRGTQLSEQDLFKTLEKGLGGKFTHQKVLVLIPDHTRSLPLPLLFRQVVKLLQDAQQLDFLVALGTHPPLAESELLKLVGITSEERRTTFKHIGLFNHAWTDSAELATIGALEEDELRAIAGECWHPSLPERVEIRLNRAALEHDHILILGPTFPHEVAGFSGGTKYLFPGISGPEMINATHWLAALSGVVGTIGVKDTPVRRMIDSAVAHLSTPVTLAAAVMEGHALTGIFIGDPASAWKASVELSSQRNIIWVDKPYQKVLSCAPAMYDELWTAAKAMYKLEPAVAVGGEVIIYAPHLDEVSRVHGKYIKQIGYHILPYFLNDWERFKNIPLGVLAHSTHLRGWGVLENGMEKPNVRVTLSSRIPQEECARLNLGYLDPAGINPQDWQGKEGQGILVVPQAGEILYRIQAEPSKEINA